MDCSSSSSATGGLSHDFMKIFYENIETGNEEKLNELLSAFNNEEKVTILTKQLNGLNCFHMCTKRGNLGLLDYLLESECECSQSNKKMLIDLPTKDGDTCLIIACTKGYNDLAAYLIFCGTDVNAKNKLGRTALHYCAITGNIEIFTLLIQHGADKYSIDAIKSTPLFAASYHGNTVIVDYIAKNNLCTREEIIQSYELVGCALVQFLKFDDAIKYWRKALVERSTEPKIIKNINPKPNVSYLFELEFTSEEELHNLFRDPKKLFIQAILIMERVVGPNHLITLKYLSESAFYFERNEDYDLSILLTINKIKNQNQSHLVAFLNTYDSFHRLLVLLMKRRERKIDNIYSANFFMVFELYAKQLKQNLYFLNAKLCSIEKNFKEFDETLVLLGCYVILFASEIESGNLDFEIIYKIKTIIYTLIRLKLKCFLSGHTILQLALSTKLDSISNKNSSYNVVKLLLECGASAMEFDSCQNTALHIIMAMPDFSDKERIETIKLLLDSGAHLDAKNENGQCPTDFLIDERFTESHLYSAVNPLKYLTLKCFAAKAIKEHNIDYKGKIPETLEHFISFH